MKIQSLALSLLIGSVLAAPLAARAAAYTAIQQDKSHIAFGYKQMGVGMQGQFKKFSAVLNFDPAKPAASKAELTVDIASIDTGSAEANDQVSDKDWFNTKQYPTARFVSGAIKPLGGNRFQVDGKLTIKGRTQAVSTVATMTPQGAMAAFDGALSIKRADFAIGEGDWKDFGTVANEIQIKFHLLARAK
ncbi:polyisoprenoid-binding protein [Chromobacterium sinusclupearum]|uniref:Polyisoprenoid-binding protein n=1 Tax=Chromobacterium sinusclupearum TaxID=2077146 RepID=A0A2K4MQP0_9NEIS|nr:MULTISPECIES: YceI family protein [Chromobacterium]POA99411.1 polyisoprenoid-binding protein [Chromobacterium sinusclupearum]